MSALVVNVSDEARLSLEGGCWTIEQLTIPQTGKLAGQPQWKAIAYYGWLSHAVTALLEKHLPLLGSYTAELTLKELADVIASAAVQVEAACDGLPRGKPSAEPLTE